MFVISPTIRKFISFLKREELSIFRPLLIAENSDFFEGAALGGSSKNNTQPPRRSIKTKRIFFLFFGVSARALQFGHLKDFSGIGVLHLGHWFESWGFI